MDLTGERCEPVDTFCQDREGELRRTPDVLFGEFGSKNNLYEAIAFAALLPVDSAENPRA